MDTVRLFIWNHRSCEAGSVVSGDDDDDSPSVLTRFGVIAATQYADIDDALQF